MGSNPSLVQCQCEWSDSLGGTNQALRDLAAVLAASPSLAWEAERGSDVAKCLGKCRPADDGGSGIGS